MKRLILALAVLALFSGCMEEAAPTPAHRLTRNDGEDRFELVRVTEFYDATAYNNRRGVYIIRDRTTGKEFIGVSGIGISELGSHKMGKSRVEDER